jgi:hypothetical protein
MDSALNLVYDEWHNFLGNKSMVDALLSRVRHYCHTVIGVLCRYIIHGAAVRVGFTSSAPVGLHGASGGANSSPHSEGSP